MKKYFSSYISTFLVFFSCYAINMFSQEISYVSNKNLNINAFDVSKDGRKIAAIIYPSAETIIYNTFSGNELMRLKGYEFTPKSVHFYKSFIVVEHQYPSRIDVWDSSSYSLLNSYDIAESYSSSYFLKKSGKIALLSRKNIILLNVNDGKKQSIKRVKEGQLNSVERIKISENESTILVVDNLNIRIYSKNKGFKNPISVPIKNVLDCIVNKSSFAIIKRGLNYGAVVQFFDLQGKPLKNEKLIKDSTLEYGLGNYLQNLNENTIMFQSFSTLFFVDQNYNSSKFKLRHNIKNYKLINNFGLAINYGKDLHLVDFEGNLFMEIKSNSIYHTKLFIEREDKKNINNMKMIVEDRIMFFDENFKKSDSIFLKNPFVNSLETKNNLMCFATRNKTIQVWDIKRKKNILNISFREGYPQILKISEENRVIVASFYDEPKVVIFNLNSGEIIKNIFFGEEIPTALDVKDNWLAVGTSKGNYYTYKISGKNIIAEQIKKPGLGNAITSIKIGSQTAYLASVGRIYEAPLYVNQKETNKLFKGHSSYVQSLSLNSSGEHLVSSSVDGTVNLWDVKKEVLLENFKIDSTWLNNTKLYDDFAIVGNGPGNFGTIIYNEKISDKLQNTNPELIVQSSNTRSTNKVVFSPNGKLLASNDGQSVKVREIKTGFLISEFSTENNVVNDIDFDKDGKSLIVATGQGIEFIDPITGKSKKKLDLKMRNRSIHQVESFKVFNAFLVNNTHGWHYPLFYHSNSGKFLGQLNINPNKEIDKKIISVKISNDGKKIATYGSHYIKIFSVDLRTLKTNQIAVIPRREVGVSNSYWHNLVDFSEDGKYLSFIDFKDYNKTIVYDLEKQKIIFEEQGQFAKFGKEHNLLVFEGTTSLKLKNLDDNSEKKMIPNVPHIDKIMSLGYDPVNNLFASSDSWGNIKTWDSKSTKTIKELDRFSNDVYHSELSPKGDFIAYTNKKGIFLFDLKQFKTISLEGNNYPYFGTFSKDGNLFYYRQNKNLWVYNLMKNSKEKIINTNTNRDNSGGTTLSSDGKLIMFEDKSSSTLKIYELKNNTLVHNVNLKKIGGYNIVNVNKLINSEKLILRGTGLKNINNKKIEFRLIEYNLNSNALINLSEKRTIDISNNWKSIRIKNNIAVNAISPSDSLYAYQEDSDLKIQNLYSKEILFDNYESNVRYGEFSKDGKYFFIVFNSGKLKVISTKTFKVTKTFFATNGDITSVDTKDHFLMVLGADNKINVFDIKNDFKKLYTTTFTGKGEFLIANEEGFYYASKGTINSVAFKKGTEIYPFEQFDLYYNRPDKAAKNLAKLGIVDSVLINAYYQAYQKRIKKMGFNENQLSGEFNLPEVNITSNNIPITINTNNIIIDIEAKDAIHNLDRINVWINDVPVFGSKGKSIKHLNSKEISQSLKLLLTKGENKVQISVTNIKGAESLKKTFKIRSNIQVVKPTLYLVSIGVSKYVNRDYNLKYAAKDAQDLSNYTQTLKGDYKKIETIELLNENVTAENVIKIKDQLLKTNVSDVVVVFYAGHGLIDDKLDYYLATHNIDFNNPSKNGLSYESLEGLLDGIPARKKLLLMDSCHSGEIDKEELELINAEKSKSKNVTSRGTITVGNKSKKMGLKNSFELMQMLFADLKRGTGAMVISSASGVEFAYEKDELKNGVFTYALLEGLKNGNCDLNNDGKTLISEIRKYVIDKVVELTKGKQNPTSRKESLEYDFSAW